VILKDCVSAAPDASVAVKTTACVPTSSFEGVPERTPVAVLKLNQEGFVGAASVSVSPTSTSLATKV